MNKTVRNDMVEPAEAEIRAAVGRIVASPALKKSPQLANFLGFVVDETLAGRGGRIKAYNVAADALGRDTDFDPQHDAIVRVEAGRLRRALLHYYSNGGAGDPIVIDLPRGHYVPVFRLNTKRSRTVARLRAEWLRFTALPRENRMLLVTIIVVAVAVSLTIDCLVMLLSNVACPVVGNYLAGAPTQT